VEIHGFKNHWNSKKGLELKFDGGHFYDVFHYSLSLIEFRYSKESSSFLDLTLSAQSYLLKNKNLLGIKM